MADPFTIIGTTSAILSFVEFSGKVIKTARSLHDSVSGSTQSNERLESVMQQTRSLLAEMKQQQATASGIGVQGGTHIIVENCESLGNEMLKLLEKTKKKKDGSFIETIRAASKTVWTEGAVKDLQNQHAFCMTILNTHILSVMSSRASGKFEQLLKGQEGHSKDLEDLQRLTKKLSTEQQTVSESIDTLCEVFDTLKSTLEINNVTRILNALRIPEMDARHDQISDAAANTFRWLMESEEAPEGHGNGDMSLATWLSEGNEVFHICAKPGAGKSTLMKLLSEDVQAEAHLRTWADGKQLIKASVFIWKSGTAIQRSFDGFARALLYEILSHPALAKDRSSLLPSLFPSHWKPCEFQPPMGSTPIKIRPKQIMFALDTLIGSNVLAAKYRFCFFIDGLDEFDDPVEKHDMIAERLLGWATSKNGALKICVSSREENAFLEVLSPHNRLRLHLVTENDIRTMVQDRLNRHRTFRRYSANDSQEICEEIVWKAEGVFLWVKLVLDAIWEDLECLKSAAELRDTLKELPAELEELFEKAFDSIPARHRVESHSIFSIACEDDGEKSGTIGERLPAYLWSFIGDTSCVPDFPGDLPVRKMGENEVTKRFTNFTAQLRVLSRGLLEITPEAGGSRGLTFVMSGYRVAPIHRTVQDWLIKSPPKTLKESRNFFNLRETVLRCCIAHAKLSPWIGPDLGRPIRNDSRSYIEWNHILVTLLFWLQASPAACPQDERIMQLLWTLDEALLWSQSQGAFLDTSVDLSRISLITGYVEMSNFIDHQGKVHSCQNITTVLLASCETLFSPYVAWALNHGKWTNLPQVKASMLAQLSCCRFPFTMFASESWISCLSTILKHGADPNYPLFAKEQYGTRTTVAASPWLVYLQAAAEEHHGSYRAVEGCDRSFFSEEIIGLFLRHNAAADIYWSWMKEEALEILTTPPFIERSKCVHLRQLKRITSTKERFLADNIKRRTKSTMFYFCQGTDSDDIHLSISTRVNLENRSTYLNCFPTLYQQYVRDHDEGQLPLAEYFSKINIQDLDAVLQMLEARGAGKKITGPDGHMQSLALTGPNASRSINGTECGGSSTHDNELRHGFFRSLKTFCLLPTTPFVFLFAGLLGGYLLAKLMA